MTEKVVSIDTQPGIQRDGTVFDMNFYTDGTWVRFQRGRPRKIGGYNAITNAAHGYSRGVYVNSVDGVNQIFNGYNNGLEVLNISNTGVSGGVNQFTLSNFTASNSNLWQFDGFYDVGGSGAGSLLAHPGQNLLSIDGTVTTPVLIGDINGTTMSQVGVFTDANVYLNGTVNATLSTPDYLIGAGQAVTGTGIPTNTTVVSSNLTSTILSGVAVTGTSGTFSCTATSGLYVGQTVTPAGALGSDKLSSVAVTGTSGTFSCTATTGLYVNQPVTVSGTASTITLASPAITSDSGTFSCTATTGLAVGQPVAVSGTYGTNTLAGVAITGLNGTFSCTATTGLYVGQPIYIKGTLAATTIATVAVTGTAGQCSISPSLTNGGIYIGMPIKVSGTLTGTETGINTNTTYYVIATDGASTFTLSATRGGSAITTTAGTTVGLVFSAVFFTGITSATTYYIIATNTTSTFTLSASLNGQAIDTAVASVSGLTFYGVNGVGLVPGFTYYIIATNGTSTFTLSSTLNGTALTGTYGSLTGITLTATPYSGVTTGTTYYIITTNGTSTFTLSATLGGSAITTVVTGLSGLTFTVANSIGLTAGVAYYIIATNYSTTFTLSATAGGSAVTTVVHATTGFLFTLGSYMQVVLSNAATTSGNSTLIFNNGIAVAGGVCVLHPYVFVYGDNGLIKNCSAGNTNNWVAADANEVNVASTKIVKGLPVRGGSNAPSGLFWALDSLIRVSYAPATVGTSTTYWRYDIITSQSSILSSQCVIEYDGIYYWCGVDRFLLYNGVVKEIPNNFNQNYFFDNLNYAQSQKVWATKVPRYGEIWWFYPRGNATECTDAIIYNVRDNIWYDAGEALGARRSAGYFSQVFRYPVNMGTTLSTADLVFSTTITTNTTNVIQVPITNLIATGQVIVATGVPTGAKVTAIAPSGTAGYYSVTISSAATASATVSANFNTEAGLISMWQHEIGVDEVSGTQVDAIESFFETSDLGFVAGGPAQASMVGDNVWVHIERVEPDFIQSGTMELRITGRPYAQADDVVSDPYYFEPDTHKIDMREQRREIRLRFTSNVAGGNYQLGKLLLSVDVGDVRGY
jgi:hypothetical protein